MQSNQIINDLKEKYASIENYLDSVSIKWGSQAKQSLTAFERPASFCFSYTDSNMWVNKERTTYKDPEHGVSSLWTNGKRLLLKRFFEEVPIEMSMKETEVISIFKRFPVSGAFALGLLMSELAIDRNQLVEINYAPEVTEEDLGGNSCYVLSGTFNRDFDTQIWVDKDSFLVRKVGLKDWFRSIELVDDNTEETDLRNKPFSTVCDFDYIGTDFPNFSLPVIS